MQNLQRDEVIRSIVECHKKRIAERRERMIADYYRGSNYGFSMAMCLLAMVPFLIFGSFIMFLL